MNLYQRGLPRVLLGLAGLLLMGCKNPFFQFAPDLERIEVSSPPDKTIYELQEDLDLAGLMVTGYYSDGSEKAEAVDRSRVSGYDPLRLGAQQLVVTIDGRSAAFEVAVMDYWVIGHPLTVEPDAPLTVSVPGAPGDFSVTAWTVRLIDAASQSSPQGSVKEGGRSYTFKAPADSGFYTAVVSVMTMDKKTYRRQYQFFVQALPPAGRISALSNPGFGGILSQ
ncbi:MAG: bacterial Ig-like domain-containing protein [Treponema sp.]|jgi:hypothetical protein|nr:bacterial Ig-like domain-containing protein [Treponema sp.]